MCIECNPVHLFVLIFWFMVSCFFANDCVNFVLVRCSSHTVGFFSGRVSKREVRTYIIYLYNVHFVTVFKDENTKSPFREDFRKMGDTQGVSERLCKPDHIYMDCMGFGMGCSCLQMTFQVKPLTIYVQ